MKNHFLSRFFLYTWAPMIIAAVIFYLCCLITPQEVPEVDIDFPIPTDKIVHFLMFFGLSIVASFNYIYVKEGKIIILKMIVFAVLVPILYGGLIEIVQATYFPDRSGDWYDFLADTLGALSTIPLSLWFRRLLLNKYQNV